MAGGNGGGGSEPPFVDTLPADEATALQALGRRQKYPKGSTLFVEGDRADRVTVIQGGRVKISILTPDGKEVVLAVRGKGDLVGEQGFLDGAPRSATATAMDPVDAVVIPATEFTDFIEHHPGIALVLLRMLSRRLRDADSKRAEFAAFDTVGRVASRLVEMAARFGEDAEAGIKINLPLTQEELAGWTGSSREAVSKALGSLRSLGWIETHRRGITIVDLRGLKSRAV
ncbi:MAG: family transcriptional regulator, cyclic receptor protein [Chloroflexota bacterium]|nr:family transcriptional regulator, cyclic receptor protein [Chloroflexota bacterium]